MAMWQAHTQLSRPNIQPATILPNYIIINFRPYQVLYKDFVKDFVKLLADIKYTSSKTFF